MNDGAQLQNEQKAQTTVFDDSWSLPPTVTSATMQDGAAMGLLSRGKNNI